MKNFSFLSKILSPVILIPLLILGCEEVDTGMESRISDMNDRITSVDKLITQPGDTVTFTGINLDHVFKVMLNTENVAVDWIATPTELAMIVPSMAPLGDVITVSLFFSGKGLAQRAITIISPPVIQAVTPSAARSGEIIRVYGRELYLAKSVYVGEVLVPTFTIVSDRILQFTNPVGSTGGLIKIVTEAGGASLSPNELLNGREILVERFTLNETSQFYSGLSPNGNMGPVADLLYPEGEFPNFRFITVPIADRSTSWGGNFDLYLQNLPVADNSKVSLVLDVRASRAMNVSFMVQDPANVYGLTLPVTSTWQTIVLPFTSMGTGYGNSAPFGQVAPFNTLTAVKIQPPATAAANNFGQTISFDNVKFIILD